jgi:hypothetical protein
MSQDQPPPQPTNSESQSPGAELEPQNTVDVPDNVPDNVLDEVPDEVADDTPEPTLESPPRSVPVSDPSLQQTLQQVWSKTQPVLKTQTIRTLRATIGALEQVVDRLEAPPPDVPPPTLEPGSHPPSLPFSPPSLPIADLRQKLLEIRQRLSNWWNPLLEKIRTRLPESINQSLSDRALTGILAGSLVLLFWVTSSLLTSKPAPVAVVPAPRPAPSTAPAITPAPPTPAPVIPVAPPAPQATPTPVLSPQVSPAPVVPPPPVPKLQRTPEQKLIAAIQDQVAEISNQYVSGLIQSVQANFRSSRLTVKVGSEWYGLTRSQQDNFANEVLQRAQQLDFIKLEITDSEGTLLARSPVVGSEMVIVKRLEPSETVN